MHKALNDMHTFQFTLDEVPVSRATNVRNNLGELLVINLVLALCELTSRVKTVAVGLKKAFQDLLKFKNAILYNNTLSDVFWIINLKTLAAAFSKIHADVVKLFKNGDVITIHGKALLRRTLPGRNGMDADDGFSLRLSTAPDAGDNACRRRH